MSILKKLGLAQKKSKGAPVIGENRKEQEEIASRNKIYFRVAIFLAFLVLLVYALPQSSFRQVSNYTTGEPWRADDLTAPFTFSLQKTAEELEQERSTIRQNIPPIFHVDYNARVTLQSRIDNIYREISPVLNSYLQWQRAIQDPGQSAENDSLQFERALQNANVELSESNWSALLEDYASVHINNQPADNFIGTRVRNLLMNFSTQMLNEGIINVEKSTLDNNEITVRDLRESTERNVTLANTRDMAEARNYAEYLMSEELDGDFAELGATLFLQVLVPNWIYEAAATQARINEALANISMTKGAVAQGQVIIRTGDIVTTERANVLRSLADARAETATAIERWLRFGGEVLIITIVSLFFLFYLYLYRRKIYESNSMFLLVFLVLGIICLASGTLYMFEGISAYIVPIAIAPLILTIIFDSRVGIMAAITLAIITAVYNDNNFEFLVATVLACCFGVFSVRDINKRTQFFITTPFVIVIGYFLVISGFALTRYGTWESFANELMFVAINSVFILFTYPMILFFEKTFNITTDFTLLEMSDTNLPLLKQLMNKAPGTFHHSLQVANLAESAATAIGANGLLCRVGGLYHDIGKMKKPGYFIENQTGSNEHDKLKPRMSAIVIKAHVSDGVKMADENDLPDTIIDFIQTHHGTSLIRYFHDKALKSAVNESEIQEIHEDDFKYDGPIPSTREQGILLLADGVEAASRSMKDPTWTKLENLIDRIVDENVQEGQLNQCPLTFHQLDIIKKTFLNILVGVHHSRIEYPEAMAPKNTRVAAEKVKQKKEEEEKGEGDEKAEA